MGTLRQGEQCLVLSSSIGLDPLLQLLVVFLDGLLLVQEQASPLLCLAVQLSDFSTPLLNTSL